MNVEGSIEALAQFGATPECVVEIGSHLDHRHLDYLDLHGLSPGLAKVTAVVEMAGRPVMYVVRGGLDKASLNATCHVLAQRGAADHIGILEPGVLTVFPLLGTKKRAESRWLATDVASRGRLPGIAFGTERDRAPGTAQRLHERLVDLLNRVTERIVDAGVSEPEDALSLVGRALFLRFLIDRKVITDNDVHKISPGSPGLVSAMETPARFDDTSRWLNATFNGNLLPLNETSLWKRVQKKSVVCDELTKILLKTDSSGQLSFQWDNLDFSHIPVGLLSQVYEKWCHTFSREKAIQDSVWYTPRSIAEYVVDEAFYGLAEPHRAKVLDPAVGAGVFLVAAYRELVAANWRHTGKRPTRQVLRKILYDQLTGFDVNEASLRLSALALYLTALELDPDTTSSHSLRFQDLRQNGVLEDVRGPLDQTPDLPQVGSLGSHIKPRHRQAYDIVVGNPPWTAWTSKKSADPEVEQRRRHVETALTPFVAERSKSPEPFEMVDRSPDLPFCWRALEWARPGGTIAFALHSRLLFRQSDTGTRARNRLFESARVTGVLNGAALAQTKVWPSHEAPFCLWFATNERPLPTDGFLFVSPVLDDQLNPHGYIRIDAAAARHVSQAQVVSQPWLLKSLYRGSVLDANIIERLKHHSTLGEVLGAMNIHPSRGYVEGGAKSFKQSAPHLYDLPELTEFAGSRPVVDTRELPRFRRRPLDKPRTAELFRGPLVLVFEAPRHDRGVARAIYCQHSVAFNHVFFGFSTASHPDGELLARYLLVLLNSSLILYVALMRSSQFGADRKRLDRRDLMEIPCLSLERLTRTARARISKLYEEILSSDVLPQNEIDRLVGGLLGLSEWDLEVIEDTLSTSLPFSAVTERAQTRPSPAEVGVFSTAVKRMLSDALSHFGRQVAVVPSEPSPSAPWLVLTISTWDENAARPPSSSISPDALDDIMQVALEGGASRIVVHDLRTRQLTVGIFAQYRYWTKTQARLLVLDLLGNEEHEKHLRGQA